MDGAETNWTLIIIIGAVIVVALIAWSTLRGRPADDSRDHDGTTKLLYEEEDNAHKGESDNVP